MQEKFEMESLVLNQLEDSSLDQCFDTEHTLLEHVKPQCDTVTICDSQSDSQYEDSVTASTVTKTTSLEDNSVVDAIYSKPYGHHPLHDRSKRPLHVLIAGAGPSGISIGIELARLTNVTFEIYEKNGDVGGTWYENRYPGAACDVASHAYQWSYEGNPRWSHHFAPAEEIGEYIIDVARKYNIYSHTKFCHMVKGAKWDQALAKWTLEIQDVKTDHTRQVEGDIFVNAGGILNDWKWPDIDGLASFTGPRIHTANWDASVELKDKRIGVIGSGATAVQLVPKIQQRASSIEMFIRSPTYILSTVGFGTEASFYNEAYSEEQKKQFEDHPDVYRAFRKQIEQQMNENFAASIKTSEAQILSRHVAEQQMKSILESEELCQKLIPKWELGCRRITPGLPYLKAVQQPNVHIERDAIGRICPTGIMTVNGDLHEFDVLICATGFETSFAGRYDIWGRSGQSLRTLWKQEGAEAYLGLAVAGFPNYFTMLGPNCPIANGSLFPCIETIASYVRQAVEKMQICQIRSIEVKQKMQKSLNQYYQRVHRDLVWSGNCSSWYKDRSSGKVTAVWPGSSVHYMEVLQHPRWEDYEIEYCVEDDPWMFLGDGRSQREFQKADLTWYLDATS